MLLAIDEKNQNCSSLLDDKIYCLVTLRDRLETRQNLLCLSGNVHQPRLQHEHELHFWCPAVPILSVFRALIVHSELKSVNPGFPVAFIF